MLQLFRFGKKTLTNSLNIYVKTTTGNTLSVDLDPTWDIKDLKEVVAPKLGLEPAEVKIIFAGKELSDTTTIAECDLGDKSVLHAVKSKNLLKLKSKCNTFAKEAENVDESEETCQYEEVKGSKPLCETLKDLSAKDEENNGVKEVVKRKANFYVFCSTCKSLKIGKLRVRCDFCKCGAFTVHSDPQNWDDVLLSKRITGTCENDPEICENVLNNKEPTYAEFFFKCSAHTSLGENDSAVPLDLIKSNTREVPCLACGDIGETVFVYPCEESHVTCLDCYRDYCLVRLKDRQFWLDPEHGYTLGCPARCANSFITELHHFRLLPETQYEQYQRFAAEEYVLQSGGVLCPQPGCGMGIIPEVEDECNKITCINGCGYVFCRFCLQGYHIGECRSLDNELDDLSDNNCYSVDPTRAGEARWEEASKRTIKVSTKPCPKCRTPTERDGGCMHMVCTRVGCQFHWCWVCQTEWTRECMGSHWFG